MADTVTMRALQQHSYAGETYEIGDTYELPADLVDTLIVQGKAVRASDAPAKAPKAVKTPDKADDVKRRKRAAAPARAAKPRRATRKAGKHRK